MTVLVFGSVNMDLVARTPRLPVPGETLIGRSFDTIPGGKGANQAVGVAQLGVQTQIIGRIGGDSFGRDLLDSLQLAGVGCDRLLVDDSVHSGVAIIAVEDSSENYIIIVPGANGRVDHTDVERLQDALTEARVMLLQLEVPLPMVVEAAQAAHAAGVTVILDPAPAQDQLPVALYSVIDIITPNQVEASQLAGFPVNDAETAERAATVLRQRGAKTAIIKLGKQGVFCMTAEDTFVAPAFKVEAVDTVAAGDAFNAGLAAAIASGLPIRDAITWGSAVAAISVTRQGAQPSMPTLAELQAFLKAHTA